MTLKRYTFSWLATSTKVKGVSGGRISVTACTYEIAKYQAEREVRTNEIDWMLEVADQNEIDIHLSLEKAVEIE